MCHWGHHQCWSDKVDCLICWNCCCFHKKQSDIEKPQSLWQCTLTPVMLLLCWPSLDWSCFLPDQNMLALWSVQTATSTVPRHCIFFDNAASCRLWLLGHSLAITLHHANGILSLFSSFLCFLIYCLIIDKNLTVYIGFLYSQMR